MNFFTCGAVWIIVSGIITYRFLSRKPVWLGMPIVAFPFIGLGAAFLHCLLYHRFSVTYDYENVSALVVLIPSLLFIYGVQFILVLISWRIRWNRDCSLRHKSTGRPVRDFRGFKLRS